MPGDDISGAAQSWDDVGGETLNNTQIDDFVAGGYEVRATMLSLDGLTKLYDVTRELLDEAIRAY